MARSTSTQIVITGISELDAKLKGLSAKLGKKYVRKATRKALVPVREQTKKNAPVDTGALRNAVKIKAMKRSRKAFGAIVQAGNQTGNIRNEFYGGFQEWGWRLKNGTKKPGTRFMKKASKEKRAAAVAIYRRSINEQIISGMRGGA